MCVTMQRILKRLKQIDTKFKLPVFGFIRETENDLSSLLNIPMMIYYLCLAYYFEQDYFEKCTKNMTISANKMTVTHNGIDPGWAYSWCKQWVDSHVFQITKWKIKINRIPSFKSMRIDIASDDKQNTGFIRPESANYRMYNNMNTTTYSYKKWSINKFGGIIFNTGDILSIILNTRMRTISVIKNDDPIQVIWQNIQIDTSIRYRLCVICCHDGNSASLIYFSSYLLS